jgi:hypothetical protein
MFRRELEGPAISGGRARLRLRAGGSMPASEAEAALLSIVFAADPALDDATGALRPGHRASDIAVRLFTVGPDRGGAHELGGIECPPALVPVVCALARRDGFLVAAPG